MRLIIGGAYQGKLAYAQKQYAGKAPWIDGRSCAMEELYTCGGIDHFQEYVKRMMDTELTDNRINLVNLEQEAEQFADQLLERNPEIVIVSTELGCGVVPVEKRDRMWRETVGRICTCIAARAEQVVRVICGVGIVIKETE